MRLGDPGSLYAGGCSVYAQKNSVNRRGGHSKDHLDVSSSFVWALFYHSPADLDAQHDASVQSINGRLTVSSPRCFVLQPKHGILVDFIQRPGTPGCN
jgi:hypothetical protein